MSQDAASVWEAFGGKLRGYLRHHLRSAADVDDVLQEVFVRVHRHAPRLDRQVHLSGWLFSVARSALVDFQRRRRRPIPAAGTAEAGLDASGAKPRVQRGRRLVREALLRCCHFVVDRYGTILEAQAVCCCCVDDELVRLRAVHR